MLFANDTNVHSEEALQRLSNFFAQACMEFGLTTSLMKTNILGQNIASTLHVNIGYHMLQVVDDFVYLGSLITSNVSMPNKSIFLQQPDWLMCYNSAQTGNVPTSTSF